MCTHIFLSYLHRLLYHLSSQLTSPEPKAFAERHGIEITERRHEVSNIRQTKQGLEVEAGSLKRCFHKVILATGSWFKGINQELEATGQAFPAHPWQAYIQNEFIPSNATMLISGSGLTAYDTAILALESGRYSKVIISSRRGYLRRVRGRTEKYSLKYFTLPNLEQLAGPGAPFRLKHLIELLKMEMEHAYGYPIPWSDSFSPMEAIQILHNDIMAVEEEQILPWRSMYSSMPDSMRHEIYLRLADDDRKEFLRNYYSLFQSFHAPMPLSNAKRLLNFFTDGRLVLASGVTSQSIKYDKTSASFEFKPSDSSIGLMCDPDFKQHLRADVWVNAMGMGRDIRVLPLYANMVSQGIAELHPDGGIRVDTSTRQIMANGQPEEDIYAIGAMSCGETVLTHNSLQIALYSLDLGRAVISKISEDSNAVGEGVSENLRA